MVNRQNKAYSLRLPSELKILAEGIADSVGLTLNSWLIMRLEGAVWIDSPRRYHLPTEQITKRIKVLCSGSSTYTLRLPDSLRSTLKLVSVENSRSMNAEIIFRLVSSLSNAEFAPSSSSTPNPHIDRSLRLSKALALAWERLDHAARAINSVGVSGLGLALEKLEKERKAFGALMKRREGDASPFGEGDE